MGVCWVVSLVLIDLVPQVLKCAETFICKLARLPAFKDTHTLARVHHVCR